MSRQGMPIKASYCDAWYTACIDDKFCASDGGDFFSCAKEYVEGTNIYMIYVMSYI